MGRYTVSKNFFNAPEVPPPAYYTLWTHVNSTTAPWQYICNFKSFISFSTTIPEKQLEKAITSMIPDKQMEKITVSNVTIPEKQMEKIIVTDIRIPEKQMENATANNITILEKFIEKVIVSNITIPVKQMLKAMTNTTIPKKQMEKATTNTTIPIKKSDIVNLGRPRFRTKTSIVRGRPAQHSEIPYIVTIKERRSITDDSEIYAWRSFCSGNIIRPSRVLTAAHCFDELNFSGLRMENTLMVVAGELQYVSEHSLEPSTEETSQWRTIDDVMIHGNYSFPFFDIALVMIEESFNFDGNVSSVHFAKRTMDYPTSCKMAGFRRLQDRRGFDSAVLMVGQITPISRSECSMLWGRDMRMFICTFTSISEGTLGDSGGPLVCQNTLDQAEHPGNDLLVGIISGKNTDKTAMFTRVSTFANWIDNSLSSKLSSFKSYVFIFIMPLILQ